MLYQSTITAYISLSVAGAANSLINLRKDCFSLSVLMLLSCMAISACTPEKQGEQGKQTPPDKTSETDQPIHKEVGKASWYGPGLNGQETANGETFDQNKMTAAHPSLPMGTQAKVTNLENGKKVDVKINDRGPFVGNRVLDVSEGAAKKLDMKEDGTTQVKIETIKNKHKKKGTHTQPRKGK